MSKFLKAYQRAMSDDDDDTVETVVIDNGSGTFLAGLSDRDSPRCVIKPNAVGRPKHKVQSFKHLVVHVGMKKSEHYRTKQFMYFFFFLNWSLLWTWIIEKGPKLSWCF